MSAEPPPIHPPFDDARTADEQQSRVWNGFRDKVLSDPKTGITVVGLLLYAVLRISYVIFYESFGLTPDDLGWSYLDLLGQAAVGLVGLTVLTGAGLTLYFLFFRVTWGGILRVRDIMNQGDVTGNDDNGRQHDARPRRRESVGNGPASDERRGRVAAALRTTIALVVIAVYVWALWVRGPLHTVAIVGTCCLAAAFWVLACLSWFMGLDEPARRRFDRQVAQGLPFAMAAAFVLVAVLLVAQAAVDAQAVREGRSARPTALGMRLASWGAERATVRWIDGAAGATFPGIERQCLMYLGKADATVYLYLPQTKQTLRLPAGDVTVVTEEATVPCVKP